MYEDESYHLNPDKSVFDSLAGDLTLIEGVKELVDNAIDNWTRTSHRDTDVAIEMECSGATTTVRDNTGGVKEEEIPVLFSLAETLEDSARWSIGAYALGTKKAIPRLGGHGDDLYDYATIKSRRMDRDLGFGFRIDEDWFEKEAWTVEKETFEEIEPRTTEIIVQAEEPLWNDNRISELKNELSKTYVKFLNKDATEQTGEVTLTVNGKKIQPARGAIEEIDWSFIPIDGLHPRRYEGIQLEGGQLSEPIKMSVTVGLMRSADSSFCGTDIYCQDRLVIERNESRAGGYGTGYIKRFETHHERLKVIVDLMTEGNASDLPWGNQKKSIDPDLPITEEIHKKLQTYVDRYFEADTQTVPSVITTAYSAEISAAANQGEIERVDVNDGESVRKPSSKLSRISKVEQVAGYHAAKKVIVDHESHEPERYKVIKSEEVPAYRRLVEARVDDEEELKSISPREGERIIDDVLELRQTLRTVYQLPSDAVDRIIDKGFLSLEDVREARRHELQVHQVGRKLAERIKEAVEPQTSREDILQELASLPEEDVDRVEERVAELYQSLLHDFNYTPREHHLNKILGEEETLQLLAENGEFHSVDDLFILDNTTIEQAFRDSDKVLSVWTPSPERIDNTEAQIHDLLQQLGVESAEDACEIEVFARESIEEIDPTPRKRLNAVWDAITATALTDSSLPEVEWVEEAGTRYQLAGEERELRPAVDPGYNPAAAANGCAYDTENDVLYLTPKFTADWDALAEVFSEGLNTSKQTVSDILEEAAPTLEDRAIDQIRRHESDSFDEVVDVRDQRYYREYDVTGCDVFGRDGDERYYIEVKARRSEDTPVRLIGDEPEQAEKEQGNYYLYVVVLDEPGEEPRFWRLSNPANHEYRVEESWRINKRVWKEIGEQIILE